MKCRQCSACVPDAMTGYRAEAGVVCTESGYWTEDRLWPIRVMMSAETANSPSGVVLVSRGRVGEEAGAYIALTRATYLAQLE